MGKTIWNKWANLIALTAGVFETIGGIFGIFYRIAMFNMITPMFNKFVNPLNVLAIASIFFGVVIVGIEYPIFPFKNTFLTYSYMPRLFLYIPISMISILNYQNVNPALYLFIASLMYIIAAVKGEHKMARSRHNQRSIV